MPHLKVQHPVDLCKVLFGTREAASDYNAGVAAFRGLSKIKMTKVLGKILLLTPRRGLKRLQQRTTKRCSQKSQETLGLSEFLHACSKGIAIGLGSTLGAVKSDAMQQTARCLRDVFSELCCPGAKPRRWTRHSLHVSA